METVHTVVAIDGPAASGKSSVARTLSKQLGFVYVNSGAMYRAVTWFVLQRQIDARDTPTALAAIGSMKLECGLRDKESTILINGEDPTPFLCEEAVNQNVSTIASVPEIRQMLVRLQRSYTQADDIVMEGRDIGSVVFPETPFKFYIDASIDVRARRRALQGQSDEITTRDRRDSSRKASPLVIAEDAHVIDSSSLTIDGVVGEIIGRLKLKGFHVGQ
ncbi:MAG: CMP/dCMP kinase [Chthoniobacter sp.]|nr:CMP/dCMP kinase [Chthoniobacter sp.]